MICGWCEQIQPGGAGDVYTLVFATLCCQDTVRIMPYRFSMADETVATRPPWLDSSLTCLPWQVISVLHGIILQYLTGFAMRSCESIRAPVSHATIFLQSIKTTAGRTSIRTLRYRHPLHLPVRPAQIP